MVKVIVAAVVIVVCFILATVVFNDDRSSERSLERNHEVYQFRLGLIALLSVAAAADARNGRSSTWRYTVYRRVPYEDMLRSRAPLESFYPDLRFINPQATDPDLWEIEA